MHEPTDRLHLVRHGEVHNPDHVVYATLPGFGLTDLGRLQAARTAEWLKPRRVARIVSSPLQRALETAAVISADHDAIEVDERLIEAGPPVRWAGYRWEDIADAFPGELDAYMEQPDLSPLLAKAGANVAAAANAAWQNADIAGDVILVGHQDPIEAGRRMLTGRDLGDFHSAKPNHGSVVTLASVDEGWREIVMFSPLRQ